MRLQVVPHERLELRAFISRFPHPISEMASPAALIDALSLEADAPVSRSEETRAIIRDVLRLTGYKPTGRGKPASEYLIKAATEGFLSSINLPVDACNVASLHSGIPISVVDLDLMDPPLSVRPGQEDEAYVFNQAGHEIRLAGLLCLCDAAGPCGNAVKDSQRTKTHPGTTQTISLLWGSKEQPAHVEATETWYRSLLHDADAETEEISIFIG